MSSMETFTYFGCIISKQNNCTRSNLCICAFFREALKYFYFYTFTRAAYTVIKLAIAQECHTLTL